ncbi:MAG: hypothetical protein N4A50_05115 [Vallitalea sp.]|nr:hypothetical protein [Vallitalea sp.]
MKVHGENLECDIVEFELESGQVLFLDLMFFGLNIGGLEQKELWEENRNVDEKYDEN